MIVVCCIAWYVIGVVSALLYAKYGSAEEWARYVSRREMLIALTVGGLCGVITLLAMLWRLVRVVYEWWDEKMF